MHSYSNIPQHKQIQHIDVGCLSVCCEYVLLPSVNKETDLVNSQAEESHMGNPGKDKGEKKAEPGRLQQPPEKQAMR